MKRLYQFLILSSMCLFLTSCYYDTLYEPIDEGIVTEDVSYELDIIQLWNDDCVSCHNGSIPPNLNDNVSYNELLDGYVVPGNAEESILYKSLLGTDGIELMPPSSQWPSSKINLVRDWINQGALNN